MVSAIFHAIFYDPLANALVWIYAVIPGEDLGVAIILLTIAVRFALYPLTKKALQSQRALQELQPRLKEIRERHKKDPQQATRQMFELYREKKINPFSGFVPILVQLPILIALFYVLRGILETPEVVLAESLYSFVSAPSDLTPESFGGMLHLAEKSVVLGVITGVAQYAQSHLSSAMLPKASGDKGDFANMMAFQMRYIFPVAMVGIASILPSGISLYLLVTTVFSVAQQARFNKTTWKNPPTG